MIAKIKFFSQEGTELKVSTPKGSWGATCVPVVTQYYEASAIEIEKKRVKDFTGDFNLDIDHSVMIPKGMTIEGEAFEFFIITFRKNAGIFDIKTDFRLVAVGATIFLLNDKGKTIDICTCAEKN